MKPTDIHSFSRSFARDHGVTPAVLLKHLGYKVRTSKNVREGKLWHYNSAEKLAKKLPYLSASTISENIKTLAKKGLLELGNYNRRKADRTQWYHVSEETQALVELDLIRFDQCVAKDHGVLAAVVHFNLCDHLKKKAKRPGATPTHLMSAAELKDHLPYSESAIRKALTRLAKANRIVKSAVGRSTFTLPEDELKHLLRSNLKT